MCTFASVIIQSILLMAGIYLHIPFCKTRCIYCDFYSTTRSEQQARYVQALCRELEMRKAYLKGETVETIYFGGGTPSQLTPQEFRLLFDTIATHYGMEHCREITLEANPDDLTEEYLHALSALPFNRISMGIQTFDDATLRLLRRRHTARQATEAVGRCRKAGFGNISIDLIYGLPGEDIRRWESDLQQAVGLHPEHISAYHLTYEEGTPIYGMLQRRHVEEVDEEESRRFFDLLTDHLQRAGYEQYEISNFCLPGKESRHNSSYWKGIPYLGCGASAHSFDGAKEREWNVASLDRYIEGIEQDERDYERELLDETTRYNEFVITHLRTAWGIPLEELEQRFGAKMKQYCLRLAAPYLENARLENRNGVLRLTHEGVFVSDSIMSDLLWVE